MPEALREGAAMPRVLAALLLLSLLAALPGPARAQDPPAFTLGPIRTRQVAPDTLEVHLTVNTLRQVTLAPEVPIPTSRLRLTGPVQLGALQESGLLGSLYQVDLNGNGYLDQLPVRQAGDALRIDQMPVEPLGASPDGPEQPFRANGDYRRSMLSPNAPEFAVLFYQPEPPIMGMDLQWRGYRPSVVSYPSPCLLVSVFEPCDAVMGADYLEDDPTFTLKFEGDPQQQTMFYWDPLVFARLGVRPRWVQARWVCLPLPAAPGQQELVFQLTTTGETGLVGLFAQVNYAVRPGERLTGEAGVTLLRNPSARP